MATEFPTQARGIVEPKANIQHIEIIAANDNELRDIETMALVVTQPKADFKLQPIILDEIREDGVLVEMKFSGICASTSTYPCVYHQLTVCRSH